TGWFLRRTPAMAGFEVRCLDRSRDGDTRSICRGPWPRARMHRDRRLFPVSALASDRSARFSIRAVAGAATRRHAAAYKRLRVRSFLAPAFLSSDVGSQGSTSRGYLSDAVRSAVEIRSQADRVHIASPARIPISSPSVRVVAKL